jgi:hypothetical protein
VAVGPLDIGVYSSDPALLAVVATYLAVYDLEWDLSPMRPVRLDMVTATTDQPPADGSYLQTARMVVDRTLHGLRASTEHGITMTGILDDEGERWQMLVPSALIARGMHWEIEDLLSLVLTIGWKRGDWVPLHAAGLTDGERGVVVCAAGGGGKTTFTMAMVRAGWKSVGDDKLLLRSDGAEPLIGGLKHMLNVDPAVDAWFPEIGDLRGLPEYSAWTIKRRVSTTSLWPDSTAASMRPTTIVSFERTPGPGAFAMEPMDNAATLETLLRQTVIPNDPGEARWITGVLATCARGASGIRLKVGDDAYVDPGSVSAVVEAFR